MLLDLAFRLRRALLAVLRIRTRGVKVMLFDDEGRIVLIRNSYGRSDLFVLPGGGIHRSETPIDAARREVCEELGCAIDDLAFVASYQNRGEGKRDVVHLFTASTTGAPRAASIEIAEARAFALDALPESVSSSTRRRIDEHLGTATANGTW